MTSTLRSAGIALPLMLLVHRLYRELDDLLRVAGQVLLGELQGVVHVPFSVVVPDVQVPPRALEESASGYGSHRSLHDEPRPLDASPLHLDLRQRQKLTRPPCVPYSRVGPARSGAVCLVFCHVRADSRSARAGSAPASGLRTLPVVQLPREREVCPVRHLHILRSECVFSGTTLRATVHEGEICLPFLRTQAGSALQ